jgi:beta-phosphoglucomutase family hydrolase
VAPVIKAILWDLDGVLADTAAFHFQAWRQTFASLGKPFTEDDFKRTFGLRNEAVMRDVLGELPPERRREISRRKDELYRAAIEGNITPLPGVEPLLRDLRARRKRMAVVTSTARENVRRILAALGLDGYLETIVSGEDVTRGKPDPEGFLLAAKRLGVAPADCLVVEDAPDGIEAGKRAGMRCVGVATSHPAGSLAHADLVVPSLDEPAIRDLVSRAP